MSLLLQAQQQVHNANAENWAAIAASLSVLANIGQSMYAKHRGKKKDPIIAAIRADIRELKEQVEHIEAKLDLVLRGRSGPQRLFDDHPEKEK